MGEIHAWGDFDSVSPLRFEARVKTGLAQRSFAGFEQRSHFALGLDIGRN
jgi:hypothetical protein